MLKTDLLQLITNGENSGVEFKRDDVRPDQLAKEIVAFANFQGGRVLLGVEDDGTVSGIQRPADELERWIMDTVFGRYIHPLIIPFYEVVELADNKKVAIITVTQGLAKPYVVRNNDREETYLRVGSISRRATREQQARLFESGGLLHAELMPVSGTGLADLDQARLSDYLVNIAGDEAPPDSSASWEKRLSGLGFLAASGEEASVCSIAGLILFGRNPRRSLRHAGIRWMSFAGTEKSYQAQDDGVLDGPLVALGEGRSGQRTIIEYGLLERLFERMRPFVTTERADLSQNLRHERMDRYSMEAIREAVVNSLVHRDWTRAVEIEIVNYSDRLEIVSPGSLPNTMTVEKMLAGQRSPRNPIVVEVMRDYGYVESRGMGVRRKIVPLTLAHSGQEARFELTDDYLKVTIPASSGTS